MDTLGESNVISTLRVLKSGKALLAVCKGSCAYIKENKENVAWTGLSPMSLALNEWDTRSPKSRKVGSLRNQDQPGSKFFLTASRKEHSLETYSKPGAFGAACLCYS